VKDSHNFHVGCTNDRRSISPGVKSFPNAEIDPSIYHSEHLLEGEREGGWMVAWLHERMATWLHGYMGATSYTESAVFCSCSAALLGGRLQGANCPCPLQHHPPPLPTPEHLTYTKWTITSEGLAIPCFRRTFWRNRPTMPYQI
jgi:hypothetical protein